MLLTHPEIPTCRDCQTWSYDRDWKRVKIRGREEHRRRQQNEGTPCHKCPKARNNQPSPESDLTPRNWQALRLYLQIKAGWLMPDDPIVRRNCALIRWVEDSVQRSAQNSTPMLLSALVRQGSQGT